MAQTLGFSGNGAPRHLVGIWERTLPVPHNPRSLTSFQWWEEVGFLFRRLVRRNYLGAPPGRSSNHGAKGATTDETESGLFQGVPTTTCCDPI